MAYSPSAIRWLYDEFDKAVPWSVELGGIYANKPFYHNSRNQLRAQGLTGDYSIQLDLDRQGDGDAASALDITMWPERGRGMVTTTKRLIAAADHPEDNRLDCVREFCGTTGGGTIGRQHNGVGQGWVPISWDDSHLWHVHISFFRKFANNKTEMAKVLSVLTGESWSAYQTRVSGGTSLVANPVWSAQDIANPSWRHDAKTNKMIKASSAVGFILNEAHGGNVYAKGARDEVRVLREEVRSLNTKLDAILAELKKA